MPQHDDHGGGLVAFQLQLNFDGRVGARNSHFVVDDCRLLSMLESIRPGFDDNGCDGLS